MREARRTRGVVEFMPHVGDFLATDQPLFALYGGATEIDDGALREAVAFGPERTLEQDPLFAFRIMVDIALKALSPAINDPTTGTLAVDQIHRLLRVVGRRRLRGEILTDGLGHAARDLSHAELGGLHSPLVHGDPALRRQQRPDRQAPACDVRQSPRGTASSPASGRQGRTRSPRSGHQGALSHSGGPRAGQRTRPAGDWRIAAAARLTRPRDFSDFFSALRARPRPAVESSISLRRTDVSGQPSADTGIPARARHRAPRRARRCRPGRRRRSASSRAPCRRRSPR